MPNSIRVPTEWVDEAKEGIDALHEQDIDLDPATVLFRDGERYGVPPGYAIHFEKEPPFPDEEEDC